MTHRWNYIKDKLLLAPFHSQGFIYPPPKTSGTYRIPDLMSATTVHLWQHRINSFMPAHCSLLVYLQHYPNLLYFSCQMCSFAYPCHLSQFHVWDIFATWFTGTEETQEVLMLACFKMGLCMQKGAFLNPILSSGLWITQWSLWGLWIRSAPGLSQPQQHLITDPPPSSATTHEEVSVISWKGYPSLS